MAVPTWKDPAGEPAVNMAIPIGKSLFNYIAICLQWESIH